MVVLTEKLAITQTDIDAVLAVIIAAEGAAQDRESGYQPYGILLSGYQLYDWLFVQYLAVPDSLRGTGVGRQLMAQAEAWARGRGLTGIWLDTFSFQARPFYEKLGFSVFGTIEDHPVGARRFFMQKRLDRS
jgi:GNAT superfamily N-acetyltransferase